MGRAPTSRIWTEDSTLRLGETLNQFGRSFPRLVRWPARALPTDIFVRAGYARRWSELFGNEGILSSGSAGSERETMRLNQSDMTRRLVVTMGVLFGVAMTPIRSFAQG